MELTDAIMVSGIADNLDKAYWLGTAYALGNPKTRRVGKSMLSYGIRLSANVAIHSTKGLVRGVAKTPLKRGGRTPGAMVRSVSSKQAIGRGATRLAPVLGQILLAYDTALIGGYVMSTYVPTDIKQQRQLGKLLMHPTGR